MEFAVDTTEAPADTRAPAGTAELALEAKAAAGMAMASRTGRTWDLLDASSGPTDRTVCLRNSPSELRRKTGPGEPKHNATLPLPASRREEPLWNAMQGGHCAYFPGTVNSFKLSFGQNARRSVGLSIS